jgi:hypothetical protein
METATITPELLTEAEAIAFLRLDTDAGNPKEKLRNLIRRHGLPYVDRGGVRVFRRSSIDAWLTERERAPRRRAKRTT